MKKTCEHGWVKNLFKLGIQWLLYMEKNIGWHCLHMYICKNTCLTYRLGSRNWSYGIHIGRKGCTYLGKEKPEWDGMGKNYLYIIWMNACSGQTGKKIGLPSNVLNLVEHLSTNFLCTILHNTEHGVRLIFAGYLYFQYSIITIFISDRSSTLLQNGWENNLSRESHWCDC